MRMRIGGRGRVGIGVVGGMMRVGLGRVWLEGEGLVRGAGGWM